MALVLGLLTLAVYAPSLDSKFVYDAQAQIENSDYLHDRSHLRDVLTLRVLGQDVLDANRPVHLLGLMTDSLLWGRQPFGYHLTSILLHSATVALLFLFLFHLLPRERPEKWMEPAGWAALGAALFLIHPVNVEPVAEVSYREDLLVAFFVMAGLCLAARFPGRGKGEAVLLGCLAALGAFLAAGSKETGFAAPWLFALYWLLFRRKEPARPWMSLIGGAFFLSALFAAGSYGLRPAHSQFVTHPPGYLGGSFWQVFVYQPRIWTFQIAGLLWPTHLAADYAPQNLSWITEPIALTTVAGAFFLLLWLSWESPICLFGTAMIALGLGPVSNFVPLFRPVADRFLYLPSLGVVLVLTGAVARLQQRWLGRAILAGGAVALIILLPLNRQRQAVFANSENLWRDTLAKTPVSETAANNLGFALLQKKDYPASLEAFDYALALTRQELEDAWAGKALVYERMGDYPKAEYAMRRAMARNPLYGSPKKLLALLLTNPTDAAEMERIIQRLHAREDEKPFNAPVPK